MKKKKKKIKYKRWQMFLDLPTRKKEEDNHALETSKKKKYI